FSGFLLVACQANYIRDVQGGTVAPSSSSELTGDRGSVEKIKGSS
ncbi:colicin release lysis protein, partial [Klebsiella pneumoniae]|nr:colicin release lysis protein [Klebsiella pneumoniae]